MGTRKELGGLGILPGYYKGGTTLWLPKQVQVHVAKPIAPSTTHPKTLTTLGQGNQPTTTNLENPSTK